MPVKDTPSTKPAGDIVRLVVDKPVSEWTTEIAKTKFVQNLATNLKKRSVSEKATCISDLKLNPPAFITESVILGSFKDGYYSMVEGLVNVDPPANASASSEDMKKACEAIAEAISEQFIEEKEKWDLSSNVKSEKTYYFQFDKKQQTVESKYKAIVFCFKILLATIAYKLQYDDMGSITWDAHSYPRNFKCTAEEKSTLQALDNEEDGLEVDQVLALLTKKGLSQERKSLHTVRLNKGIKFAWNNITSKLTKARAKDVAYPISEEQARNDEAIVLRGLKSLIDLHFEGKLDRKISLASLNLIRSTKDALAAKIACYKTKISVDFAVIDAVMGQLQDFILNAKDAVSDLSDIMVEVDISKDTPTQSKEVLTKLPFSSAPKVKSTISLKRGVNPPKWNPDEDTLWEHLKSVMEYALEYGILENSQKLNLIFSIFKDEHDRREYQEMVLDKIDVDQPMSEEQFTKIIHKICYRFDRENVASSETYRAKLEDPRLNRQRQNERMRAFMNRLTEWFSIAYPDSHQTAGMKKALCKRFYEGLIDRKLATEVATSEAGYKAIYKEGTPNTLLQLVQDQAHRNCTVKADEEKVEHQDYGMRSIRVVELSNRDSTEKAPNHPNNQHYIYPPNPNTQVDDSEDDMTDTDRNYSNGNSYQFSRNSRGRRNYRGGYYRSNFNRSYHNNQVNNRPYQNQSNSNKDHNSNDMQYHPNSRRNNYNNDTRPFNNRRERPNPNPNGDKRLVSREAFRDLIKKETARLGRNANVASDGSLIVSLSEIPFNVQESPGFDKRNWIPNKEQFKAINSEAYRKVASEHYFERPSRDSRAQNTNFQRPRQQGAPRRGKGNAKYENKKNNANIPTGIRHFVRNVRTNNNTGPNTRNIRYVRAVNPSGSEFAVPIQLGHQKRPTKAILDSGAVVSILSTRLYHILRSEGAIDQLKPEKTVYLAAAEQEMDSLGYVITDIHVGNTKLKNRKLAVLDISSDILLGGDFFTEMMSRGGLGFSLRSGKKNAIMQIFNQDGLQKDYVDLEKSTFRPNRAIPVRKVTASSTGNVDLCPVSDMIIEPGQTSEVILQTDNGLPLPATDMIINLNKDSGKIGSEAICTRMFKPSNGKNSHQFTIYNNTKQNLSLRSGIAIATAAIAREAKKPRLVQKDIDDINHYYDVVDPILPDQVILGKPGATGVKYEMEPINAKNPGDIISMDYEDDDIYPSPIPGEERKTLYVHHKSCHDGINRKFEVKHNFSNAEALKNFSNTVNNSSRLFNIVGEGVMCR